MRHTGQGIIGASIVVVMQLFVARTAGANCAIYSYIPEIDAEAGTVVICADGRDCSGGEPLIRQDVETGEVVEISGACQEGDYSSCFVDECVPVGSYRYGLEEPLQCGCGSREVFVEVEVTTTVQACVPSEGAAEVVRAGGAPWGDESYHDCVGEGCSVGSGSSAIGFPAFALVGLLGLAMMLRRARRA